VTTSAHRTEKVGAKMAETMLQQRIDFILPDTVKEKILTLEGPACNVTTGDSGII